MYKKIVIIGFDGKEQNYIIKDNGNNLFTSFPENKENTDYQAYLKWVAESSDNKPLPADE